MIQADNKEQGLAPPRPAKRQSRTAPKEEDVGASQVFILAVGDVALWKVSGNELPNEADIAFIPFEDIDAQLIYTLNPSVVLSPLLSERFDCIDLANVLCEAGFTGRYRVITQPVPNPQMIRGEIRSHCPNLDFELVVVPKSGDFIL